MSDSATAARSGAPTCPACGEVVGESDQFCESCGAALRAPSDMVEAEPIAAEGSTLPATSTQARTCSCGGTIDADGWCTTCGLRAPSERDHFGERTAPRVAFVCDKGIVHPRNEDAAAAAVSERRIVLVVCDGVTSATDSDVASLAAARAARDHLAAADDPSSTARAAVVEHWTEQLSVATEAAQAGAAAAAEGVPAGDNPPSSTFVAAVVDGPVLVAAWVGDSRCYWLPDAGPAVQVSTDDSWASNEIAHGIPREVAESDARAHAITRWLGVDSPGGEPSTASVALDGPGWVLVCSDGLWNYCSPAESLRDLLVEQIAVVGDDPFDVASALCRWANDQGGHDNVTAAVAHLAGTDEPAATAAATEPPGSGEPEPATSTRRA